MVAGPRTAAVQAAANAMAAMVGKDSGSEEALAAAVQSRSMARHQGR